MKLISLKIDWFKNLKTEIDFTKSEWISVFVWNNWSWKSNVLEAISAIFYGLYDETNERRCDFSYELKYYIDWKEIFIKQDYFETKKDAIWKLSKDMLVQIPYWEAEIRLIWYYIDWKYIKWTFYREYLPTNIIALYSWEETRLYQNYYREEFQRFRSEITWVNKIWELPKMNFIDKDYWEIALITMFISVVNFDYSDLLYKWLQDILWKWINIENIYFDINKNNLKKFNKNEITNFVNILDWINNISIEKLIDLNNDTWILWTREEFFKNITLACDWKNIKDSLIYTIDITFNNWINSDWLSEWQKKQILIYFVTEILADKDSIILLDEPDSYIHVGNKKKIKGFFNNFLDVRKEGEFIMTTHSPTLMHEFLKENENHIHYLENWKIISSEKADILREITWNLMSFAEQQIVLNTNKDILLVEWKLDEIFIKEALNKITDDKYKELRENIVFIPTGWASWLRLFIDKFQAKDNQKIIWILDGDKAWKDEIKEILDDTLSTKLKKDGFVKIESIKNTYLLVLPKLEHITDNQFEIEDYFPLDKLITIATNQINTFKVLKNFTLKKDMVKRKLETECVKFVESDFIWFKVLFDLILDIKKED